jgi:hypothetical protein
MTLEQFKQIENKLIEEIVNPQNETSPKGQLELVSALLIVENELKMQFYKQLRAALKNSSLSCLFWYIRTTYPFCVILPLDMCSSYLIHILF